jgi:hypothetical protein
MGNENLKTVAIVGVGAFLAYYLFAGTAASAVPGSSIIGYDANGNPIYGTGSATAASPLSTMLTKLATSLGLSAVTAGAKAVASALLSGPAAEVSQAISTPSASSLVANPAEDTLGGMGPQVAPSDLTAPSDLVSAPAEDVTGGMAPETASSPTSIPTPPNTSLSSVLDEVQNALSGPTDEVSQAAASMTTEASDLGLPGATSALDEVSQAAAGMTVEASDLGLSSGTSAAASVGDLTALDAGSLADLSAGAATETTETAFAASSAALDIVSVATPVLAFASAIVMSLMDYFAGKKVEREINDTLNAMQANPALVTQVLSRLNSLPLIDDYIAGRVGYGPNPNTGQAGFTLPSYAAITGIAGTDAAGLRFVEGLLNTAPDQMPKFVLAWNIMIGYGPGEPAGYTAPASWEPNLDLINAHNWWKDKNMAAYFPNADDATELAMYQNWEAGIQGGEGGN